MQITVRPSTHRFHATAFVAALAWLAGSQIALAQLTDEQAIETARETLRGRSRAPWYDREEDGIRELNVAPSDPADSANRKTKWAAQKGTRRRWNWGSIDFLSGALQVIGLTVLVALLILIGYLISKAFLKTEITETKVSKVVETAKDTARVEALPFQLRKPTSDFLSEARRLYEAGNYSEAIIYFYSYQLVQLDRHHVIRLAKGKTNRQYLRETRTRPLLRDILDCTMVAFEDVFFGHHTLSRERFDECWRRLDEFHAELERLERAAA